MEASMAQAKANRLLRRFAGATEAMLSQNSALTPPISFFSNLYPKIFGIVVEAVTKGVIVRSWIEWQRRVKRRAIK